MTTTRPLVHFLHSHPGSLGIVSSSSRTPWPQPLVPPSASVSAAGSRIQRTRPNTTFRLELRSPQHRSMTFLLRDNNHNHNYNYNHNHNHNINSLLQRRQRNIHFPHNSTDRRPSKNNNNTTAKHVSHPFSTLAKKRPFCPYKTLNIPKDSSYSHAKKSFLQIAMKHHPDTVGNECEETRRKSQQIFMTCRSALEMLVECRTTGKALLKTDVEEEEARQMTDEEFDSWFEQETGHSNPFNFDLDPELMREVADMHDEMESSHGLDRDGGMWHLASLISSTVRSGKEGGAASVLKLEAGSPRDGGEEEARGRLERRRRRRSVRGGGMRR